MAKKYTAQEAKNLILDTAAALFIEKGYEQTSISQIVAGLDGLTKGAVYHHFDSKNQIIVGIAQRFIPNKKLIKTIAENKNLNGLEKIQEVFLEGMFNEDINQTVASSVDLLTDATFSAIYNTQMCQVLVPVLEQFIIEGNEDGSINVIQPKEMAEFILLTTTTWFIQALFPETLSQFFEKLTAAQYVLRKSGIDIISDNVLERIINELTAKGATTNEEIF